MSGPRAALAIGLISLAGTFALISGDPPPAAAQTYCLNQAGVFTVCHPTLPTPHLGAPAGNAPTVPTAPTPTRHSSSSGIGPVEPIFVVGLVVTGATVVTTALIVSFRRRRGVPPGPSRRPQPVPTQMPIELNGW